MTIAISGSSGRSELADSESVAKDEKNALVERISGFCHNLSKKYN
ncbi:MAG: hypothetical protein ACBR50_05955 [Microcoleus sp.]